MGLVIYVLFNMGTTVVVWVDCSGPLGLVLIEAFLGQRKMITQLTPDSQVDPQLAVILWTLCLA